MFDFYKARRCLPFLSSWSQYHRLFPLSSALIESDVDTSLVITVSEAAVFGVARSFKCEKHTSS